MELRYKTRGGSSPQGKQRVYFTCHPDDFALYFDEISEELLKYENCSIYYYDKKSEGLDSNEDLNITLEGMQLFVIPITSNFLHTDNRSRLKDFKFAVEHHIPVLPLMQEPGLETSFNKLCGDIQYLSKIAIDDTAIPYEKKLSDYLSSVLIGDELATQIRNEFDAYIFLSYRKKDRSHAKKLMSLIHENDFCRDIAIWYDEYLLPGENFNESIDYALKKCHLFALVVTPNLIIEPNYVNEIEYPTAMKLGKIIMPVEMLKTRKFVLRKKFKGIPAIVSGKKKQSLRSALSRVFSEQAKRFAAGNINSDSKHLLLIGLAYLDGIDVEVNRSMGFSLITTAADSGYIPAMKKMREIYLFGKSVKIDLYKAISWQEKIAHKLESDFVNGKCDVLSYLEEMYRLGDDYRKVGMNKKAYDTYVAASKKVYDNLKKVISSEYGVDLAVSGLIETGRTAYLIKEVDSALMWYNFL